MSSLSERLAAIPFQLLFGVVGRMIPFRACRIVARPIALVAWASGVRRSITMRNLAIAFPEVSDVERRRIARRSFVNLVTVFLEMLVLRHMSTAAMARAITIDNLDLLRGIDSNGALLLSAHFGNWELLALAAGALSGVPFAIVVKEQRDHGQLNRMRTSHGNSVIPTSRAARETAALLRRGGLVAMLADQAAADDEPVVRLFGVPTHTFSAPARLALRFRPRIVTAFAARRENGTYHAVIRELPYDDLEDNPDGIRELAQRYVALLEAQTIAHPEQWAWQHRKWKSSPGVHY
ncbi:MAG: lysophospholipid acyltransferase family protein [Bacteroidetes bacterium]|nr:lysophospholipid acyltransferase family protein [Bacteroidota bacterium]